MRRVMVRYTVKPGRAEENERLVRDVYDELHRTGPDGIRYATFRLADVAAFARFQEAVTERCDVAPVVTELTEVGSYRLLGEAIGA